MFMIKYNIKPKQRKKIVAMGVIRTSRTMGLGQCMVYVVVLSAIAATVTSYPYTSPQTPHYNSPSHEHKIPKYTPHPKPSIYSSSPPPSYYSPSPKVNYKSPPPPYVYSSPPPPYYSPSPKVDYKSSPPQYVYSSPPTPYYSPSPKVTYKSPPPPYVY
ncbi:Proline-rich extensin-like family protein [Arabidopsis thaliana]|uniref:Proline-rich extensin-like family protein n=1 Tax=Arabidopsis thaliana TaxID=3702 RepID=A0A1P8B4B8_ARATH|nr:Proline-rich extensin-like family protein [Arabidopsis thaliana]ANM66450.1 Proline-rich extensin-like family protein [Arabidopsis thaliana]|eukprot:NP_001328343.1 Proline-rich extensin-like family protein [Arabidopsis thaliana]